MPARDRGAETSFRRESSGTDDGGVAFRSAEAWLTAHGIEREPLVVDDGHTAAAAELELASGSSSGAETSASNDRGELSEREADRLVSQSMADAVLHDADARALPDPTVPTLENDVAEALAFVRRSTSVAPQSETRIRAKLAERGWVSVAADRALEQARRERLVDDVALAAALVDERRRKGHAAPRIRRDLHQRGFDATTVEAVLTEMEREDPEAAAFDTAWRRASQLSAVPAEKAFARVVGYLTRRGYAEGLARKVAREAVFTTRDEERVSGH